MKGLVTHPQWDDFLEWLRKEVDQQLSVITFTENEKEMYRLQGMLRLNTKIANLRDKLGGE